MLRTLEYFVDNHLRFVVALPTPYSSCPNANESSSTPVEVESAAMLLLTCTCPVPFLMPMLMLDHQIKSPVPQLSLKPCETISRTP
jgi:hypothetical protein